MVVDMMLTCCRHYVDTYVIYLLYYRMLTVFFWDILFQATASDPQPSASSSSSLGGAEYRELVGRLDRIEAEQKGLYASHAKLKEAYQNSHIELKGGLNLIMEQLKTILSMLHHDEVFPDGYDLYEDALATPIGAAILHNYKSNSIRDGGNEFIYFIFHLRTQRHWVAVEVDIEL
uniref:Uncharacterized protein n=1 Tax=Cannabis sativa TaxID=3483 RepID=A0A803PTI5_CANSA